MGKWLKRFFITLGVVSILAGGLIYMGGCLYFQKHFFPETEVAGFDVSFKTAKETEDLLNEEILSYALAIDTRNGGREKLSAEQVGMQYHSTGEVQKLLKEQPYYKWLTEKGTEHSLKGGFKLNRSKFEQAVQGLKCASHMQAPVDARILKVNGKYQVIPEIKGTQVDMGKAKSLIETAMKRGDTVVSLEECYKNPSAFQDDPELVQNCKILNQLLKTIITYDFGDRSEFIDGSQCEEWIVGNKLDKGLVREYVQGLANEYDTRNRERTFITYDDREVPLIGGEYGWKIDVEKETDALYDLITKGTVTVREPVYEQKALCRERNDIGYDYLEIDSTAAKIVLYIDGTPIVEDEILSYGSLPAGCNYLQTKSEVLEGGRYVLSASQDLKIYGISADQEAQLKINQSNGQMPQIQEGIYCVLSENTAKTIFDSVPDGCPVIIY